MAFSQKDIQRAPAKKVAAMTADPPGPDLTEEQRREIDEEEKTKREEGVLTEEDRQRVYGEEQAKEEPLQKQEEEGTEIKLQSRAAAGLLARPGRLSSDSCGWEDTEPSLSFITPLFSIQVYKICIETLGREY